MSRLKYDGRCTDQGGGGGGDGANGEPELCCTLDAKGEPTVLTGRGDGANGEPELHCTLGANGEPAVTISGPDANGEPGPRHAVSSVDANGESTSALLPDANGEPGHIS